MAATYGTAETTVHCTSKDKNKLINYALSRD
jgi:hypothetical protein